MYRRFQPQEKKKAVEPRECLRAKTSHATGEAREAQLPLQAVPSILGAAFRPPRPVCPEVHALTAGSLQKVSREELGH